MQATRRGGGGSSSGGLPSWLIPLIALIVGIALGVTYGWIIDPVEVVDTDPPDLRQDWQQQWVAMTGESYAASGNSELARQRLQSYEDDQLRNLLLSTANADPSGLARQQLTQLAGVRNLSLEGPSTAPGTDTQPGTQPGTEPTAPQPTEGGGGNLLRNLGIGCLAFLLLAGGAVVLARQRVAQQGIGQPRRRRGGSGGGGGGAEPTTGGAPPRQRLSPPTAPPLDRTDEDDDDLDGLTLDLGQDDTSDDDFREIDFGEPEPAPSPRAQAPAPSQPRPAAAALDQFVARYNLGDTDYDVNFVIETPQAEFLGECGVAVSEALDNNDPQRVTALEVWLFDKDDIRTITKVMLSDYASKDEGIRGRLAPKGELVTAREGEVLELETASLRVQIRMREVAYGWEPEYPEKSYFERIVLELTPMQKVGGGRRGIEF